MAKAGFEVPIVELDISVPDKPSLNIAFDGEGNLYVKSGGSTQWDFEDLVMNINRNRTAKVIDTDTVEAKTRVEKFVDHTMTFTSSVEKGENKKIDASSVAIGNLKLGTDFALVGKLFLDLMRKPGVFSVEVTTPAGPGKGITTPGPAFAALYDALSKTVKLSK